MRHIIGIGAVALIAIAGWRIGASASDASFALIIGVLFGAMFFVPTAMIAIAAPRKSMHMRIDMHHYMHHYMHEPMQSNALQLHEKRNPQLPAWHDNVIVLPATQHKRLEEK